MRIKRKIREKFFYYFLIIRPSNLNNLSYSILFDLPIVINCNKPTDLCLIMNKSGTDKALYSGISKHNYTTVYHAFFKNIRQSSIRLFELGLGTTNPKFDSNMGPSGVPGASLRGWKEYFKKGEIFGADIDKSILFEEERIKTFYCNQLDYVSILSMWNFKDGLKDNFDIIIDDGLHTFEANVNFLKNSFQKLKRGGFYIVEDVLKKEIENWIIFLSEFSKKEEVIYLILKIPNRVNYLDNNLIFILKK